VDLCPICTKGHFTTSMEAIAFSQWTDRGTVRCEVTILVARCSRCNYATWGSEAEAEMQAAVHRAYEKLR
jgi:hypothetical protein